MKTALPLLACLLVAVPALAEDRPAGADAATSAGKLDLSLPRSAADYRNDPPGTWYGDTSGVPASAESKERGEATAREEQCQGELHGSVAAGIGHASRGGNSNWQAVNLHGCKTYYNDDGEAREVGVSISVGQYDGPDGRYRGGRRPTALPPMGSPRR